jgi:protocadherin Fat 4
MPIDRERLETIQLKISARDGGTSPKFAYTSVNITLLDENDEAPTFGGLQDNAGYRDNRLELRVSELATVGTKLATLKAVDRDRGSNGTVRYQLSAADAGFTDKSTIPFGLNTETGELTVNSQLDRETVASYDLVVTAEDMGRPPLTSSLAINIQVEDVNDNAPIVYPTHYFVVLQPDFSEVDLVVQVRATDRDAGLNAELEYELLPAEDEEEDVRGLFSLEAASGRLFLRPGAMRQLRSGRPYQLRVGVHDSLGRQATASGQVEVVVEGAGLEYLSCGEDLYRFSLEEDSALEPPQLGRRVLCDQYCLIGYNWLCYDTGYPVINESYIQCKQFFFYFSP